MWEQLKRLADTLSRTQKAGIVVVALISVAGIALLLRHNRETDFRPVYSGLAAEDAGQVVSKLKEANVEYRLADNGASVLVPSAKVAEVRLLLASSGLPKSGRLGFELFDKTNFGASEFAEQINYRRALEGELERSVMSISEVEHARVHVTFAKESVFADTRQPAKASVLLKLRKDATLSKKNVIAIGHLVASAVERLTPEGVSVVDMQGNLLSEKIRSAAQEDDIPNPIEYRQKIEQDLLAKIYSTLEPVLGADHFRAGVSVEVDFSSGEQSEENFDPDRSVMVSQQRTEEANTPSTPSGVPGTASNLPRPTSRPGTSANGLMRRTENINYQTSRTVRRTRLPQGGIRRLSVSAILDQTVRWEGAGPKAKRILEPPSEEVLKKVRDLMAGAVGFQQERGDQIFVQSLPFEATLRATPPPEPAALRNTPGTPPVPGLPIPLDALKKLPKPVQIGIGAGLALLLIGGGVFAFLRKKKRAKILAQQAALQAAAAPNALAPAESKELAQQGEHAEPESVESRLEKALAQREADHKDDELEFLKSLREPDASTRKAEVLIKHIAEQAKRDPSSMAHILRGWITEKERT